MPVIPSLKVKALSPIGCTIRLAVARKVSLRGRMTASSEVQGRKTRRPICLYALGVRIILDAAVWHAVAINGSSCTPPASGFFAQLKMEASGFPLLPKDVGLFISVKKAPT